MTDSRKADSLKSFQNAAKRALSGRHELVLYIAGTTPLSAIALANVVAVCDELLPGRYDLTVVDVYQEPVRTQADQIVAVPTLLKKAPMPVRRIVGDLSDRVKVVAGLGLPPEATHETK